MWSSEPSGLQHGERPRAAEQGREGRRGRPRRRLARLAGVTVDSACQQPGPAGRPPNPRPVTRQAAARQAGVPVLTAQRAPVCQKNKENKQRISKVRRKPGTWMRSPGRGVSGWCPRGANRGNARCPPTSKNNGLFPVCRCGDAEVWLPGHLTSGPKPLVSDTRRPGWRPARGRTCGKAEARREPGPALLTPRPPLLPLGQSNAAESRGERKTHGSKPGAQPRSVAGHAGSPQTRGESSRDPDTRRSAFT